MSDSGDFGVITTTVESLDQARDLARQIVDSRLAACVHVSPVESVYRWKGAVESATEHLLAAKAPIKHADKLITFIRDRHTYDVPEIIVVPIAGGSDAYMAWLEQETRN
jgi:periplasmic divalent cation tolerance protein